MKSTRRSFIKQAALTATATCVGGTMGFSESGSGSWAFQPEQNIIPAPIDPKLWPEFRNRLAAWRDQKRKELHYSDALYQRPDFAWTRRNFCCCFLMLCDETIYDRERNRFTPGPFLEHGRREFGGYDSVVLWHAYPRIGLDARNQFDFYRDMPGGLPGLRRLVELFHEQNVHTFIDYNPWDTGTRREGKPDLDALCEIVKAIGADGIFLDTMDRGAPEFRAKLDTVRPGVILESEGALPIERIADHHASWAQHFDDSEVPGVLRNKWFDPRHLQHQIRRWSHDHTSELHAAWMNGSGTMVWENVFGSWMGWSPRDRSILRSMLPIQRRFSNLFSSTDWMPLAHTSIENSYASQWGSRGPMRLWTVVNRKDQELRGEFLSVELGPQENLYDLITGQQQKKPEGRIRARGVGCWLAANPEILGKDFSAFLKLQHQRDEKADWSASIPQSETRLIPLTGTPRPKAPPTEAAEIGPATARLVTRMRNRECGFYDSNPPDRHRFWQSYDFSTESFERNLPLSRIAIDLTPVTNADYYKFLKSTGYRPKDSENFLRHWTDHKPPPGKADHPVVYVDLNDARAYARWAGKRLPTEEEWQFAAQGTDGRRYAWGNEMQDNRCNRGQTNDTTPVILYPDGRSPFGLLDMCGNVWHWTESERTDGRTRFCIIRGGSFFQAKGSGWYMDGGPQPVDFAAKFLLMWAGLDRCGTIGFRCVTDLA